VATDAQHRKKPKQIVSSREKTLRVNIMMGLRKLKA